MRTVLDLVRNTFKVKTSPIDQTPPVWPGTILVQVQTSPKDNLTRIESILLTPLLLILRVLGDFPLIILREFPLFLESDILIQNKFVVRNQPFMRRHEHQHSEQQETVDNYKGPLGPEINIQIGDDNGGAYPGQPARRTEPALHYTLWAGTKYFGVERRGENHDERITHRQENRSRDDLRYVKPRSGVTPSVIRRTSRPVAPGRVGDFHAGPVVPGKVYEESHEYEKESDEQDKLIVANFLCEFCRRERHDGDDAGGKEEKTGVKSGLLDQMKLNEISKKLHLETWCCY